MESINLSKFKYVSSCDSKVARLGQGVDIMFSQGSGTSTERVKITIVLHYYTHPYSGVKMTVCVASYENQRTYGEQFGESSDFLNFAICVYPRDKITDMRKKSGPYEICGADWHSG